MGYCFKTENIKKWFKIASFIDAGEKWEKKKGEKNKGGRSKGGEKYSSEDYM